MFQEMNSGMCGLRGGGPFMVVLWVLIIMAAVFALRRLFPRRGKRWKGGGDAPLDVLKMRFARGEISAEEYEKMKSLLKD